MKQITSFELYKLKEHLETLNNAWFDKCFHSKKENKLLIRLRTKEGKKSLFFLIPNLLIIKDGFFSVNWTLSNFGAMLRKRLKNSKLINVEQYGFDRILKLNFSSGYSLWIELFGKGAVILTDENNIIISAYPNKNVQRGLKPKQEYRKPDNKILNPFSLDRKAWKKISSESGISIVKVLASKMGFGKIYAEEICFRAGIEKSKVNLTDSDITSLIRTINELKSEKSEGLVYIKRDKGVNALEEAGRIREEINSQSECSIIRLKNFENPKGRYRIKEFASFFNALTYLYGEDIINEKKEEKTSYKEEVIIKKQSENLNRLVRETEENKEFGEAIYSHYDKINEALKLVKSVIEEKSKNPDKIKKIKEKNKNIKEVNLKDKYFIIEV